MRLLDDQLTKRRHDVNVGINGKTTPLSIGLGVGSPQGGAHKDTILFGPELEFGNVVGNHIKKQVLLLKYAKRGDVAPTSQQPVPSRRPLRRRTSCSPRVHRAHPQVRPYTKTGGRFSQRLRARRGREFAARTAPATSACLMTRKALRLRMRPIPAATSVVRDAKTPTAAVRALSTRTGASAIRTRISYRDRVARQAM